MKLAWLTDIHINFLNIDARFKFYEDVLATDSDGVLITGDIAEAPSLVSLLTEMVNKLNKPIYFIVGNHDYYRGAVNEVRDELADLNSSNPQLFWLPETGLQLLPNDTILLGQDGWADGRLGDYQKSPVSLNDSVMISDLFQQKILGRQHLLEKMQQLADKDANSLKNDLIQAAMKNPKKIIVLTHVPPFKETCKHRGEITDDNWLPYFGSKVTGDVLMSFALDNPSIDLLVLCGHTHSEAHYQPIPSLIVKVGKAEYYHPAIQEILTC